MYQLKYLDETRFIRRAKQYEKSNSDELFALFDNLKTYKIFMDQHDNHQLAVKLGFVHRESAGVVALDQKGCIKKSARALRMYLFVFKDEKEKTIYVLTIGDKNTQKEDNNWCKGILKKHGLISERR